MRALITKQREVRCTSWQHEEQVIVIIRFLGIPIYRFVQDKIQIKKPEELVSIEELLLRR